MNVLIITISQSYALQLRVVCFNSSLSNDLQRHHYVMTLLVGAHHY